MPRTRRSVALLTAALIAASLTGCAAADETPTGTETPVRTYPDVTPTADMSVEVLDRQVWAAKALPGDGARSDGIVPAGRTMPPVSLDAQATAWEAQIVCAADREATLVATVTVDGTPSTVEIPCAVGVEATPEITTLSYPADESATITITFSAEVMAIYAVLQR